MKKISFVRARIEPSLKEEVENILHELGISPSQAITMLYKHVALRHEWPLDLKIPNKLTKETFGLTDSSKELVRATSSEDMFKKLGI
jgi:DNA-damage-inducible protein J